MNDYASPDGPMDDDQCKRVAALSAQDVQAIDDALLSRAIPRWRKVARIVGDAMFAYPDRYLDIPDIYYAERVKSLVCRGLLEARGDRFRMGFSEVRLALGSESPDL